MYLDELIIGMWVFVLHFPSSSYCIWKQFSLCGLFVCFLLNFDPNQNINSHGRFSIIVIQFRPRAYEFQKIFYVSEYKLTRIQQKVTTLNIRIEYQ